MTSFNVADLPEVEEVNDLDNLESNLNLDTSDFDAIKEQVKGVLKGVVTKTPDNSKEPNVSVIRRSDVTYFLNKVLGLQLEDRHFNSLVAVVSARNDNQQMTIPSNIGISYLYPKAALLVVQEAFTDSIVLDEAMERAEQIKAQQDKVKFSKIDLLIKSFFGASEPQEDEDIFGEV